MDVSELIPLLMMLGLIIGHTAAIMFMKKKRSTLDASTPEGQAGIRRMSLIITILYVELPLLTAIIWLVVKPALMASTAN